MLPINLSDDTTYQPMNPEIKAKWIEALRSRDYEQGYGFLCLNDKFCCLGVLTKIIKPNSYLLASPHVKYPNLPIINKANLSEDAIQQLVDLNDSIRANFQEIANWIEEKL
jgi:hypothetical protein